MFDQMLVAMIDFQNMSKNSFFCRKFKNFDQYAQYLSGFWKKNLLKGQ